MKKIIYISLTLILISNLSFAQCPIKDGSGSSEKADDMKCKPLDLGEETPEEEAHMQRERQETWLENSGDESMEDMATGTTEDERSLGFGPNY